MQIGAYHLSSQVLAAPMAGVSDLPYRRLCRQFGAGLAVSEMVASDPSLRHTRKSQLRSQHIGEDEPCSVQIVGTDPETMAQAARYNVEMGAHIIDINMGCPAKKVCSVAAGSALLRDETLVANILEAVVSAVDVPVTLKTRTGWDPDHRNIIEVARIAENSGIQALTVHGRTRACAYSGEVDYAIIADVKASVSIPIIANGDIDHPEKARQVLQQTGADAIMIGRAAQGQPWLFSQINALLETGQSHPAPDFQDIHSIMHTYLSELYDLYGELHGVRIARKHIKAYLSGFTAWQSFRPQINACKTAEQQLATLRQFFEIQLTMQQSAA